MGKAIIWDLDGTLLDSYHVIVESLRLAFQEFGVSMTYEDIWQYAITFSSTALIDEVSCQIGVPAGDILLRYSQISGSRYTHIRPMEHSLETLEKLSQMGVEHYVYTHRGKTTMPVLEHLGIDHYFKEVLTSRSGFARKPAPDAICYLLNKYGLSKEDTYYAGDRSLDMECAENAGIPGILYLPQGSRGTATGTEAFVVRDLLQIPDIFKCAYRLNSASHHIL